MALSSCGSPMSKFTSRTINHNNSLWPVTWEMNFLPPILDRAARIVKDLAYLLLFRPLGWDNGNIADYMQACLFQQDHQIFCACLVSGRLGVANGYCQCGPGFFPDLCSGANSRKSSKTRISPVNLLCEVVGTDPNAQFETKQESLRTLTS